ncbi:ribosome maturation factor RimP [Aeromicrobium sp. 636]|uniref:Ribosome maturation factor RimP n=1 Tax=Aeromicrobium senzhongii TaxID=2663859 RepID=A0A8I0ESS5_9ACTN|nr:MULTISPECIES: ribosome maturation factor RimP [Aeromicrobium]MBC9224756.1 ribosome maturation factor RimP [Aeromicrobium senzhongii]MCQ3996869.1 ribosome maturation factor RimP [Aeromicrobium sp. 636]MTB86802.1 ribosome maturation factor RimP [Aeromicrobium senzhongii]QNL93357.1 ribosome maturation factor RimP [Aeromicrobium senzhongii]
MTTPIIDRISSLLEPVTASLGLDLEEVELLGKDERRRLLVAVDRDGGVGIDQVAEATRAISAVLDESDVMGEGRYTLEVASRGVDRPLVEPRHWRRNAGRLVAVELTDGERFEARIGSSDDSGVELSISGDTTRFPYDEIVKAVVQIELNRKDV